MSPCMCRAALQSGPSDQMGDTPGADSIAVSLSKCQWGSNVLKANMQARLG
jgi:hypothetical protein